jgi:pSer/pThr/pTyr-binding forkhead associated (FHA) protein
MSTNPHRFELAVKMPGGGTRRFPLKEGRSVIGRSPACEVFVADNSISRKHACFEVHGSRINLEDLNSLNGTLVNDKRIKGATAVEVGEEMLFGDLEALMVYADSPDTEIPEEIWLEVLNTSLKGKVHRAVTPHIVIGRSHSAEFQVNHPTISRAHAILHYSPEDGGWMLSDQRSANGTYVDGVMVSKALVTEHEKLRVGDVELAMRKEPPLPSKDRHTILLVVLISLLGVAIALLLANLLGLLTG